MDGIKYKVGDLVWYHYGGDAYIGKIVCIGCESFVIQRGLGFILRDPHSVIGTATEPPRPWWQFWRRG